MPSFPLFAVLALAVLVPCASGQDNYVNRWKTDVLLDRSAGLDLTRRPKVVILVPAGTPGLGERGDWQAFLKEGRPALAKSQGADFSLDFLPASAAEGTCVAEGRLAGECAASAAAAPAGTELVVLLHGLSIDSADHTQAGMTSGGLAGVPKSGGGFGQPGAPGLAGGMALQSVTVFKLSGEILLAEAATGKILYHARNLTDGTSLADARGHFIQQAATQLSRIFDPGYGGRDLRNVLSVHPVGLILAAANFPMYQVTYERRLGDSRASLYWNPILFINDEDDEETEHHIYYALLPLAGLRYYFREGGAGPLDGGKTGYAFFEFIDKPKPGSFSSGDIRWTKAHMGFLAGELGLSIPLGRVRLHGSGTVGLGLGWKKAIEADGFSEPEDERGFGVLPVFDLSTGVGYAF